jgi:hypothetical protein
VITPDGLETGGGSAVEDNMLPSDAVDATPLLIVGPFAGTGRMELLRLFEAVFVFDSSITYLHGKEMGTVVS